MEHCQVMLTANAGVCLILGETTIWIDALHDEKQLGFSTLSPVLWGMLQRQGALRPPDLLLFTHCHKDHFSAGFVEHATTRWPKAKVILPETKFPQQVLLEGDRMENSIGTLQFTFVRLPHAGQAYATVPHYGVMITHGGTRILIPGDCKLTCPMLTRWVEGCKINLALVNFPWIVLQRGQEWLRRILQPEHLLVYHLPFLPDDCFGYRAAARKGASQMADLPDVRLLDQPFQKEVFEG